MTRTNMDLSELLAKQDGGDFLRAVAEAVLQLLMEADVEGLIGAGKHERSSERTTWRNGYRVTGISFLVSPSPCHTFFEKAIFDGQIGHALFQSHRLAAQILHLG